LFSVPTQHFYHKSVISFLALDGKLLHDQPRTTAYQIMIEDFRSQMLIVGSQCYIHNKIQVRDDERSAVNFGRVGGSFMVTLRTVSIAGIGQELSRGITKSGASWLAYDIKTFP
jgi:hypothetical protein